MSARQRMFLAMTVLIALLLLTLVAGLLANKYFRLSALDDYRAGYAQGVEWREAGGAEVYDCHSAMESRYGQPTGFAQRASDGWGEFRVGCEDGMAGESAAAWYELRERMWGAGGVD